MKKIYKLICYSLLSLAIIAVSVLFFLDNDIAVLNPKGIIGLQQRDLLVTSTWLMLIVVIPVFILSLIISWKYRASNAKAKYRPEWDYSLLAECIWWGLPFIIITVLGVMVWTSSHKLDPLRPLESDKKTITIQVVALQWRWLFIYPEQKIASLSFVQFPEQTPIRFEITSDAPMNSFWIPKLGGQIYAMPGMRTELYLMADEAGSYPGSSANLSGEGFAGMKFIAKSTSQADFDTWVESVRRSTNALDSNTYKQLAKPSQDHAVISYVLKDDSLFDQIIMKYMMPMH